MGDGDGEKLLEGAYGLTSPEDNLAYYREFAARYDTDFVEALGYSYAATVAGIYRDLARPQDVPVADIGCGTGLVGAALGAVVDGMDISPEMLELARVRGAYRRLFAVDLAGDLAALPQGYGAVVSAGAFTYGHLGAGVLTALLGLAQDGALFVIGVNAAHFTAHGFEVEIQHLRDAGRIGPVTASEVPIYDKAGHDHAGDRALVLTWRAARR